MNYSAETYQRVAGVNIRDNSGVLATLYHQGTVLQKAQNLRDNRATDVKNGLSPRSPQVPPKEMGEYVIKYQSLIRNWLGIATSQTLDYINNTGIA